MVGAAPETTLDVRMAGVSYGEIHLRSPFSVRAPLGQDWRLYVIRGGDLLFEADDVSRTRQIMPYGSVIALSGMLRHRFSSTCHAHAPATATDTRWVQRPLGTAADGAVVVSVGSIATSRMAFLAPFQRVVLLSAKTYGEAAARFARAIAWIAEEAGRPGPESNEIIRRLAEITTLEIGRFERARTDMPERSKLQAASDQRILRAVAAFYAAPQEKWSVERLADVAGMSRTAFAVRYRQLIGTTPLRSVRQARLQLSAERLGSGGVASAAAGAGYGSGTTFIRAFANEFGTTPGKIARSRRAPHNQDESATIQSLDRI